MNQLIQYIISVVKGFERGDLDNNPDPDPPSDLGTALTQEDIDFIKKLRKETEERFAPPSDPHPGT